MSRPTSLVFLFAFALLAACGKEAEIDGPPTLRPPIGPWVLDVEALAASADRDLPGGQVELRLLEGGRFEGQMAGAGFEAESVAGRWSWDGTRFELRMESRAGRPSDEGGLVGTYDGRVLRLQAENAPTPLEMVFVRP